MFRAVYIFVTSLGSLLLPIFSIFIPKLKFFSKQRKKSSIPSKGSVKYCIHCASLGEYEMAIPFIEEILKNDKPENILITIFSPSGYNQAIQGEYAERVMYLPLDTLGQVKQFYKDYAPSNFILIRYDFWYNLISQGLNNGTQFHLVNGRFQENHFIFKWYGKPYLKLIKQFKNIFTSDSRSKEILESHSVKNVSFNGDTRFDRVNAIAQRAKSFEDIATFKGNRKLLIVGSSWQQEEELVQELLESKPNNLAIVIAPHDLKRSDEIAAKLTAHSPKKFTEGNSNEKDSVLILDTMGMLSSVYQYADFALIGGGFSGALHNILEPAVWGCHLSFGPKTKKFPEAQDFIDQGFAFAITEPQQWVKDINSLLADTAKLETIQHKAKTYTSSQIGATQIILDNIG